MNYRTAGIVLCVMLYVFLSVLVPVHAASSLVQRSSAFCVDQHSLGIGCTGTTLTASFSSNVASGNLLVVAAMVMNNPPVTLVSLSDSRGSSFTQTVVSSFSLAGGGAIYDYIYYAPLTSSGADTITATFNSTLVTLTSAAYLHIFEVSGVTTTAIATGVGSGMIAGSSSGPVGTSSTVFQSGAFLVAIAGEDCQTGQWTVGGGFTLSPNPPNDQFYDLSMSEYSTSGVSSPTTFSATLGPSSGECDQHWVEAGAAFNPAAVTTTTPPLAVGGKILPVNLVQVLTPWVAVMLALTVVAVETLISRREKSRP